MSDATASHADATPALSPRERRRAIVACIGATVAVSASLGLSWPFLALVLERQGVPTWLNGLSASAQMAAVLAILPVAPRLIARFGTPRVMMLGIAGTAASMLLISAWRDVWAWFVLRFLLGFFVELVYTGADIWINQLAHERTRGRLIAVFSLCLHGGFSLGPLAIAWLGPDNWTVMYLGAAVVLAGIVPLIGASTLAPAIEGGVNAGLRRFLRIAPSILIAALMFGLVESAVFALLPVYGVELGLDAASAAVMVTVFVAGGMATQLPVGWLSDHVDRRLLLAAHVGVSAVAIGTLPFAMGGEVTRLIVLFIMGGALGCIYEIAMAIMGERFRDAELVGVNTCFVFLWGIGMMFGPFIAGGAMHSGGPHAFPTVAAVLAAACFVFISYRIRRGTFDC